MYTGSNFFLTYTATSGSGDYEPVAVPITFSSGSGNGALQCVDVTVYSDNLVEFEENFKAMLTLTTPGSSFNLGINTSVITLIDSDGRPALLAR